MLRKVVLAAVLLTSAVCVVAAEKRVDNAVDAWTITGMAPAGKSVEATFSRRPELLDTVEKKHGDFSVVFAIDNPSQQGAVGFSPGQFHAPWAVGKVWSLHLWARATAPAEPAAWMLALVDTDGHRATASLSGMAADGRWRQFDLPLASFTAAEEFQYATLCAIQLEATLGKGAKVWLDDVYFHHGDEELGVSDKSITQYMAEARATRAQRVEAGMATARWMRGQAQFGALWVGKDLERTNQELIEYIDENSANDYLWALSHGSLLQEFYFTFGSKSKIKPGRLSPECEKRLLAWVVGTHEAQGTISLPLAKAYGGSPEAKTTISMPRSPICSAPRPSCTSRTTPSDPIWTPAPATATPTLSARTAPARVIRSSQRRR